MYTLFTYFSPSIGLQLKNRSVETQFLKKWKLSVCMVIMIICASFLLY